MPQTDLTKLMHRRPFVLTRSSSGTLQRVCFNNLLEERGVSSVCWWSFINSKPSVFYFKIVFRMSLNKPFWLLLFKLSPCKMVRWYVVHLFISWVWILDPALIIAIWRNLKCSKAVFQNGTRTYWSSLKYIIVRILKQNTTHITLKENICKYVCDYFVAPTLLGSNAGFGFPWIGRSRHSNLDVRQLQLQPRKISLVDILRKLKYSGQRI